MKLRSIRFWSSLILVLFLVSCIPSTLGATPTSPLPPTATLSQPNVSITGAPDVQITVSAFLEAWKAEDYEKMYGLLSHLTQEATKKEDFTKLYQETALNLTLQSMETEILSTLTNPNLAQASYRVTFHTVLLGDIQRDMVMSLSLENGNWRVAWEDGLILPELHGGNRLKLDVKVPARGNIYDKNGDAIASQTEAVALGIEPDKIDKESTMLIELSNLTGLSTDEIRASYKDALGTNWYIPVGDALAQDVDARMSVLSGLGGVIQNRYATRYYYDGGIAAQTIGYVQPIPAEDVQSYLRKGYLGNERVGMAGLEKSYESTLMGQHGADLYVVDRQGQPVNLLKQRESTPAQSIYTTIDMNLQEEVQRALDGFKGAAVVMERDTGKILAIASSPTFNPNLFDPANYNYQFQLGPMLKDGQSRLLNRAAQGLYPLGSVFKLITMAAALESGLYTKDTTYDCGSKFTELPGLTLYDWTFEWGQPASGKLTLPEGLMRSCDPFFYHIGLDLFRHNHPTAVSDMARGFGLGQTTGTGEIDESAGSILNPVTDGDAVQQAIGQGTMLVTPLQVVDFIAALGNGGTLYSPQFIEKIVGPDGQPSFTFKKVVRRTLPLSPENLKIIQDAMFNVVNDKRGTAFRPFLGINIPLYGKTGTAQNPGKDPHAWFAGYTNARQSDKPDIAIVVIAENSGEGSQIAAPIFRRILEVYFQGKALTLYPWESRFNVTKTPTSEYTNTPLPTDTPSPTIEGQQATETPTTKPKK